EAKACRHHLRVEADHEVDPIDVVLAVRLAIYAAQFGGQIGMLRIGEIVEGLDRLLVQELEHAVVSGDASFAVAQDVDRREIQYFPVEPPEFAKESGEVVDGNGARVADAKG